MKTYDVNDLVSTIKAKPSTVVLFGAGGLGKLALYALKKLDVQVNYFCDSNEHKDGHLYCGIKVISPKELSALSPDTHIFVSNNYLSAVIPVIEKMNFANVYGCATLLENTDFSTTGLDRSEEADPKFHHKPLDIQRVIGIHKSALETVNTAPDGFDVKYIDVVVTERCSMKCKDCSNLMQYYLHPKDSDLDLLLNSIDKVMKCIDHLYEFRVLGGEPFVNKEIHKIVDKLVSYNNADNVVIYTNATIVPRNENLTCLKNKKVKLDITNYVNVGLSKNHDNLIEVLIANDINYVTQIATTWSDSGTIKYRNTTTEEKLIHQFQNCCVGDVLNLLNGKLYRCPFSANAHNLNAIPFDSEDVIDLSDEKEDVVALKAKIESLYTRKGKKQYLTACGYCGGRDCSTPEVPAGVQTKTIIPLPSFQLPAMK